MILEKRGRELNGNDGRVYLRKEIGLIFFEKDVVVYFCFILFSLDFIDLSFLIFVFI